MRVLFVTGNKNKVKEASTVLSRYSIVVEQSTSLHKLEVQSDDLHDIVRYALAQLCGESRSEIIVVEDDGLFVDSLKGFPGPYSAYVYSTIGVEGLLKLLGGIEGEARKAEFKSVVGACIDGFQLLFDGEIAGHIAHERRGGGGFGFDPVFIPAGESRTFAEMGAEEKSAISHRARAFKRLAEYLTSRGQL